MPLYASKGKDNQLMNVNAEQGCLHIELRIVGNSNKLVYLTSRIATIGSIKFHNIFRALTDETYASTWVFQKLLKRIALFTFNSAYHSTHCFLPSHWPRAHYVTYK